MNPDPKHWTYCQIIWTVINLEGNFKIFSILNVLYTVQARD
jgi:hypothetical protein